MGAFLDDWIGRRASGFRAALVVFIYAATYTAYCQWLFLSGHQPSAASPLLLRITHYQAQARLLLPASYILWLIFSGVVYGVARSLGGKGGLGPTFAALGPAWTAPLLVLFVVPDILICVFLGFDRLLPTMLVYGPIAALVAAVLTMWSVRRLHGLSWERSAFAALVGGFVLAALHGPWLR